MSEVKDEGTNVVVVLKGPRLFFPNLWEPDKYKRYSAVFGMSPGKYALPLVIAALADPAKAANAEKVLRAAAASEDNYAKVVCAIIDVARAKWKAKWLTALKEVIASDALALRDGDRKADLAGYAGNYVLSATNKSKPLTINGVKEDIDKDSGMLFSGCHPIARVEIWAFDSSEYGKQINCQLLGVQHWKGGERVGGGGKSAKKDEFEEVSDPDANADDDLVGGGGLGDDIPF